MLMHWCLWEWRIQTYTVTGELDDFKVHSKWTGGLLRAGFDSYLWVSIIRQCSRCRHNGPSVASMECFLPWGQHGLSLMRYLWAWLHYRTNVRLPWIQFSRLVSLVVLFSMVPIINLIITSNEKSEGILDKTSSPWWWSFICIQRHHQGKYIKDFTEE